MFRRRKPKLGPLSAAEIAIAEAEISSFHAQTGKPLMVTPALVAHWQSRGINTEKLRADGAVATCESIPLTRDHKVYRICLTI
jgi:hypothetical protein